MSGRLRRLGFVAISIAIGCGLGLAAVELTMRVIEARQAALASHTGPGGHWEADPIWGWRPTRGDFRASTHEFSVVGHINEDYMNDRPAAPDDADRTRVLVLGDSHTYAIGVSTDDTYAKQLETLLNRDGDGRFRTYNTGMPGYSMHQYLLRLIDQGPRLKPDYVVVGVSLATDLYDLEPPDRGGWVYYPEAERDYFDFDASGRLERRHWAPAAGQAARRGSAATRIRGWLGHSAVFRKLRRSNLTLAIGARLRSQSRSLWPGVEAVVERETSASYAYNWRLFSAIVGEMRRVSEEQGASLVLVTIPYLPQVYDDVWNATFGANPRYDREAGVERIRRIGRDLGVSVVDSTPTLRRAAATHGRWVHFREDAHPTVEGHAAIAAAIHDANVLHGRR